MLEHLRRIVARLRSFGARFPPPAGPPEDPDISVREPRWRRPSGGHTAVAVVEPQEPHTTMAVAAHVRAEADAAGHQRQRHDG
jgi:hypothetical protein